MKNHILVGFGLGPIQAGLFAAEAFKSGHFNRIVISEVDQKLIDAIRADKGRYTVNVASLTGITTRTIDGIELYNPAVDNDRQELIDALTQATEIVTSLPSVDFYETGQYSVASLIACGLENTAAKATIIYTAENNNHAAEILEQKVKSRLGKWNSGVQFLNTVIGKMSQVVMEESVITEGKLATIAPDFARAFLVEEFNRILVTKCSIPGFAPGIEVFIEKQDLLPFEEAKLYGHNAIHALLAYLGMRKGYKKMAELAYDVELMKIARQAFMDESGSALIRKYGHLKEQLFTENGFQEYAEDLLARMTNPYLNDTVERASRDPRRKLGLNDRIFGTMQLCLEQGIEPENMALAAAAAVACWMDQTGLNLESHCSEVLQRLWQNQVSPYKAEILKITQQAYNRLQSLQRS